MPHPVIHGVNISIADSTSPDYDPGDPDFSIAEIMLAGLRHMATPVTPGSFTDDTEAAANGVPVGGQYHNLGTVQIRLV